MTTLTETAATTLPALTARAALDAYFLEVRCKLLDAAAILDRIDRGDGAEEVLADPRMKQIQEALEKLQDPGPDRAERIQQVFSQDYDPTWAKPAPHF